MKINERHIWIVVCVAAALMLSWLVMKATYEYNRPTTHIPKDVR